MKNLLFCLTLALLSCTKGEKSLESGTWNLDSYVYNSVTHSANAISVTFSSGKMNIKNGNIQDSYTYTADNTVINVNGVSYGYSASKKKLVINAVIYPHPSDVHDPFYSGTSNLSK